MGDSGLSNIHTTTSTGLMTVKNCIAENATANLIANRDAIPLDSCLETTSAKLYEAFMVVAKWLKVDE